MAGAVRIAGDTGESFTINHGVKQGCVLTPTLFSLYLAAVLESMCTNLNSGVFKTALQRCIEEIHEECGRKKQWTKRSGDQWSIKALPLSNGIVSRNIKQLTTGGSHQQLMVLNATVARWICSASTLLQHVTVSQSTSPAVDCRRRWNSVSIHDGNLKDFFK